MHMLLLMLLLFKGYVSSKVCLMKLLRYQCKFHSPEVF